MNNKTSDKNVDSIEKDIERCKQLTKPEHANWIGISNQLAIAHILAEREQDKERIKELEEELEKANRQLDLDYVEENFTPKQKIKEGLEDIEDYFYRLNGPDEDIEYIRQVKNELLGGEK